MKNLKQNTRAESRHLFKNLVTDETQQTEPDQHTDDNIKVDAIVKQTRAGIKGPKDVIQNLIKIHSRQSQSSNKDIELHQSKVSNNRVSHLSEVPITKSHAPLNT